MHFFASLPCPFLMHPVILLCWPINAPPKDILLKRGNDLAGIEAMDFELKVHLGSTKYFTLHRNGV